MTDGYRSRLAQCASRFEKNGKRRTALRRAPLWLFLELLATTASATVDTPEMNRWTPERRCLGLNGTYVQELAILALSANHEDTHTGSSREGRATHVKVELSDGNVYTLRYYIDDTVSVPTKDFLEMAFVNGKQVDVCVSPPGGDGRIIGVKVRRGDRNR